MKFANVEKDKLFRFGISPQITCLVLSGKRFQNHKKAKKRHWYYVAGFYDHETKMIVVDRITKVMMRSHMNSFTDVHLSKLIKTESFTSKL